QARRGRGAEQRPIVVGQDAPRRVAIIAASGLWRWRFRGGVSADAFTALWGSIFDWLAAERADRRAAVPDERLVRAGDPIRWRRGAPVDSVVTVVLRARGTPRVDSLTLRFAPDASVIETKPIAAGVYDVTAAGRAPRLMPASVTGAVTADAAPRLRGMGWVYGLAIALLCVEWILRRRRGMR